MSKPIAGSGSPRPSPRGERVVAELSQTPPARIRSASRAESSPRTPPGLEAQTASSTGKVKRSPWLKFSSRKSASSKAGDIPATPQKSPTSPTGGRLRTHSSPSRFGEHHTRVDASPYASNSSNSAGNIVGNSSAVLGSPLNSPVKLGPFQIDVSDGREPPWYLDLGAAGRKLAAAGQQVEIHPMLTGFRKGLRVQFRAMKLDPNDCPTSPRYLLGVTLLGPVLANGPLTPEEFRARLEKGIQQAEPKPEVLNFLIETMEAVGSLSDSHPPDFHRATNVFYLARRMLNQQKLSAQERAEADQAINQEINQEISKLVSLMWPQEKHNSLHSPARVREAKARYPELPGQTPSSPGAARTGQNKQRD